MRFHRHTATIDPIPRLDLILPGTDGIGLMNTALTSAEVPVIFLSIYG